MDESEIIDYVRASAKRHFCAKDDAEVIKTTVSKLRLPVDSGRFRYYWDTYYKIWRLIPWYGQEIIELVKCVNPDGMVISLGYSRKLNIIAYKLPQSLS